MKCAWQELLNVLPPEYRADVDRLGKGNLWELRLRSGHSPEFVGPWGSKWMTVPVKSQDIRYVVNAASRYSPWAAGSIAHGYLTTAGGHRIGFCGDTVMAENEAVTIKNPTSLCIRVARDHPGIAGGLPATGSLLIIGPPGAGKTTLLRDLVRHRSEAGPGAVAVVDERRELFPEGVFDTGPRTDVLTGCPKSQAVEMVLRTMGPRTIAVDEITAEADCEALIRSGWCGVELLATAHGKDREELFHRPVYRKLVEYRLFDWLVILQEDKSWKVERM